MPHSVSLPDQGASQLQRGLTWVQQVLQQQGQIYRHVPAVPGILHDRLCHTSLLASAEYQEAAVHQQHCSNR